MEKKLFFSWNVTKWLSLFPLFVSVVMFVNQPATCDPLTNIRKHITVVDTFIENHVIPYRGIHSIELTPELLASWNVEQLASFCYENANSLAVCYDYGRESQSILYALLIGAIDTLWRVDLDSLFSPYLDLLALHQMQLPVQVQLYTPGALVNVANNFFDVSLNKILLQLRIYDATYDTIPLFTIESNNPFSSSLPLERIIEAWWLQYQHMHLFIEKALYSFAGWEKNVKDWAIYIATLQNVRQMSNGFYLDINADTMQNTLQMIDVIKQNTFFEASDSHEPYITTLPKILETAVPAKMVRLFCTDHPCPNALVNLVYNVDYVEDATLMKELTNIITEERRYSTYVDHKPPLQLLIGENYRYSVALPEACLHSEASRYMCDMCGLYQPAIHFYVSQLAILQEYANDIPYIYDLLPTTTQTNAYRLRIDFDGFNTLLLLLYRDLQPFFDIKDELLAFWVMTDWHKDNIFELYQLYRGRNLIWEASPPSSSLQHKGLAMHAVGLQHYSLRAIWTQFFHILRSRRMMWWKSILQVARDLDTTQYLSHSDNNDLMTRCSQMSLLDAIVLIQQSLMQVNAMQVNGLPIDLQRRLMVTSTTNHVKGTLEVFKDICHHLLSISVTKKSKVLNKLRFWDNHKEKQHNIVPRLPNMPSNVTLLQDHFYREHMLDYQTLTSNPSITHDNENFIDSPTISELESYLPLLTDTLKRRKSAKSLKSLKSFKSITNLKRRNG